MIEVSGSLGNSWRDRLRNKKKQTTITICKFEHIFRTELTAGTLIDYKLSPVRLSMTKATIGWIFSLFQNRLSDGPIHSAIFAVILHTLKQGPSIVGILQENIQAKHHPVNKLAKQRIVKKKSYQTCRSSNQVLNVWTIFLCICYPITNL